MLNPRELIYETTLKQFFFRLNPENAHELSKNLLQFANSLPFVFPILEKLTTFESSRLQINVAGINFKNPLGMGAGFDKTGELYPFLAKLGFGHVEIGTITGEEQPGNPKPRIFRYEKDSALVNRMGFNNPGSDKAYDTIQKQIKTMLEKFSKKDITATNVLIFITVVMYIIQINIEEGGLLFGLNLYFLVYNFWWQPLSTIFAHGGIAHLGMNMFVLWQFGNLIERSRSSKELIALYLVTGIITSLLSFAYIYYLDNYVNLVGASGAICALLGYVAYYDKAQRSGIITWVLLISVAPLIIGLPIAWYAHFIGLAVGFLYALIRR